ncbi:hypothetical protein KKH30_00475 [Candidatus Micrarchaeota archaeon]|nr:hypothetical protein [Candidatus Micrarchaeota archaeon]MBU1939218.1 hypothetical protein [Candidatus Micrarchaeota archaeon]
MSLISLTFGKGREAMVVQPHIQITNPQDSFREVEGVENRVEVVKVCKFFNSEGVYVVGKVLSGVIAERMRANVNGWECEITELECKYKGADVAKEGMTVGLMVRGVEKEAFGSGEVLQFTSAI